jgi:5-oxoprolinase (ATP-hydrolysing) subunit A
MASRDVALAGAVARAVAAFSHGLILLGPPGSELLKAGRALGLRVVGEAFADRAYEPDGSLVSRKKLGAIVHDVDVVVERSVRLAKNRTVVAIDGSIVHLQADTICVHGDTPGADELAAKLREALERAGVEIKPMGAA